MGEKFAANPVTGTGSMSVPMATSPGCSGFGPQLSLSYDSGIGNGPYGLGWNHSVPSITRKTDKGLPKYHDAEGHTAAVCVDAAEPRLRRQDEVIYVLAVSPLNSFVRDHQEALFLESQGTWHCVRRKAEGHRGASPECKFKPQELVRAAWLAGRETNPGTRVVEPEF
jgi:hypothetical protein